MSHRPLEWEAQEHVHMEKTSDWYWAVGIITVAAVVTSIIFNNILFGLVLLLGSITLTMHAMKEPPYREYRLTERGLHIDEVYYPFQNLESFWIEEDFYPTRILIKSKKVFMPLIVVPLHDDMDPDLVRGYLLPHIKVEEHHEPLLHKVLEYLGF